VVIIREYLLFLDDIANNFLTSLRQTQIIDNVFNTYQADKYSLTLSNIL